MPELKPFRGIHYADRDDLKDLVCPPYDVISAAEQARLYVRHPNNAVRIELPFSERADELEEQRYRRAGRTFDGWLSGGVLVEDEAPSFFVYRQDFGATDGARKHVVGVIGALTLERFGPTSGVLPHEHTLPGPIEDRLSLLRACPVNISPIYGIFNGAGALVPFYDSLLHRPAAVRFADDNGTLHRIWRIGAPAEIAMFERAVGSAPLVIADGHHRYETALAFHEERGGGPGHHDAVMCLCVDADAEDLQVRPYHRVFMSQTTATEIEKALVDGFSAKALSIGEGVGALAASSSDHPLLFLLPDREILVGVADQVVTRRVGGRSAAWRGLDVVALHEVVIPEVFPAGLERVMFSSELGSVVELVRNAGWSGGVVLRALRPVQVIEVARSGERMPQKASYFSPKALTGLVFRSLV
ncbi:MAG: DUF1015 family protein [Actinomycetota bacterium]